MSVNWITPWLRAYREHGTVTAACRIARISRTAVYEMRERDPEFKAAWDSAERETTKLLEETAFERALAGSDRLAEFLLKARRPETYRENIRLEHGGTITHEVEAKVDRELAALERQLGVQAAPTGDPETRQLAAGD